MERSPLSRICCSITLHLRVAHNVSPPQEFSNVHIIGYGLGRGARSLHAQLRCFRERRFKVVKVAGRLNRVVAYGNEDLHGCGDAVVEEAAFNTCVSNDVVVIELHKLVETAGLMAGPSDIRVEQAVTTENVNARIGGSTDQVDRRVRRVQHAGSHLHR